MFVYLMLGGQVQQDASLLLRKDGQSGRCLRWIFMPLRSQDVKNMKN